MTRQVTDQLYIELGYYDPEAYYVYIAEAECSAQVESTVTCVIGKVVAVEATLTSEFTQTTTISHIEGADLFAFSEAAIAIAVERIRDVNIAVSSQFDIATDAIRLVNISADQISEFTQDTEVFRTRSADSQLESAFSISAEGTISGAPITAEAALTSEFTQVTLAERTTQTQAALSSDFTVDAAAGRIRPADSQMSSDTAVSVSVEAIRETEVQLESTATLELPFVFKTVEFTAALTDAFTPTVQVEAIRNSFAVLDAVSTVTADADRLIGAAVIDINSEFTLLTTAGLARSFAADMSVQTTIVTTVTVPTQRPRPVFLNNISSQSRTGIETSIKRFGTASGFVIGAGYAEYTSTTGDLSLGTGDFAIEIWTYPVVSRANDFAILSNPYALTVNALVPKILLGTLTLTSSTAFTLDSWNHLVISKTGSRSSMFLNGVMVATSTTSFTASTSSTLRIRGYSKPAPLDNDPGIYYDDFSFHKGSDIGFNAANTTIVVPTEARSNLPVGTDPNQTFTQLLVHFDGNFEDDVRIITQAQAGLTSSSTVNVSGSTNRSVAASMSSASSVTVVGTTLINSAASLSSQGFVVAAVVRKVDELADLVTTASLAVNAGKLIALASDVESTTAVTASATRIKRFNAAITGAFTAAVTAQAFEGFALLTLPSVATVTAKARYANGTLRSSISAQAQITATGREIVKDPAPVITPKTNRTLYHFNSYENGVNFQNRTEDAYNSNNALFGDPLKNNTFFNETGKFGSNAWNTPETFNNFPVSGQKRWNLQAPTIGTGDFTIDFWFKPVSANSPGYGTVSPNYLFRWLTADYTNFSFALSYQHNLATNQLIFVFSDPGDTVASPTFAWPGDSGTVSTLTGFRSHYANTWYHVALQRNGTQIRFFINGQTGVTYTSNTVENLGDRLLFDFRDDGAGNFFATPGAFDELRIVPYAAYSSTFTPPTAEYDVESDIFIAKLGDALLEPRFSLGILITQNAQANLSAAFAQATAATRTRRTSSTQSSQFAQTATVTRTRNAQALVSAAATVTATVNRFRTGSSTQSVTSTLAAEVSRTRDLDASIQSQTVITAAASRTRTAVLDISSSSDLSVAVERIRSFDTEFASIATQLAAVGYNATGTVLLESEFTTTAQAEKTTDITLDLLTVVDLTADSDRIRDLSSDIVSDFTIDIDADKILPFGAVIQAEFAQTANTDQAVIRGFSSDLSSSTEFSIVDTLFNGYSADLTAETELSITATRLKLAQSQLNAESEFTITAGNLRSVSVSMTAFAFQLAAGQVLKLDPALQIRVPQETRHSQILKESRVIMVEQETRVNMIL